MIESGHAIRAQFNASCHVIDVSQMKGLSVMVDEAEDVLLNGITMDAAHCFDRR